jgi:hypothetical protein
VFELAAATEYTPKALLPTRDGIETRHSVHFLTRKTSSSQYLGRVTVGWSAGAVISGPFVRVRLM